MATHLALVPGLLIVSSAGGGDDPSKLVPPAAAVREALGTEGAADRIASVLAAADGAWVTSVTPYLWLYGLDGEVRIRSTSADFDVGFDDLLENLDLALMVHVEAWKGRVGLYLDPGYGALTTEADAGPNEAEVKTDLALVDFGAFYRVLDRTSGRGRARAADLSIGGRWVYLKNEIDLEALPDREKSGDFVDLTVGGRYSMDLGERFGFLVGGDVGGFDLGSSSELAWNAQALGFLRVGRSGRLWGGYRILDMDRDDGGSTGAEVQFSGPILGYEFRL